MTVELARAPYSALRALAATVMVMSGAVVAHTWAGGHLPGLPALLALAGVVLGAGALVLRGLVGVKVLLPVVAVAQTGLHGAFGLLAPAQHTGHAPLSASAGDPAQWSWQMLAAHAAGTVLTALAWWVCDRAVIAVVTLRAVVTAHPGGRRAPRSTGRTPVRPSLVHLVVAPRRGPPVAA